MVEVRFDDVRGKRLLIALSGGADSVALLHLSWAAREEFDLQISAAHLNHGIRGADADGDAAFCREVCRELGVELISGFEDIPALARAENLGLESAARRARYTFLYDAKARCNADFIALAHHRDDQAETVLMHLLRGTGPEGICGMPRISGALYRPLLDTSRAELREYLEARGIGWREDATNGVSDNPRNALRLNVLPEIEKSYPRAAEAIARYAQLAKIESDFLSRAAERFMRERISRGVWGWRADLRKPWEEALLRRVARDICRRETGGDGIGAQKMEEIVSLAHRRRGKLSISPRLTAEKTPDALYFLRSDVKIAAEEAVRMPGETLLPGICRIAAEEGNFEIEPGNPDVEILDADALRGAVLRTRRDGDRIRPLGNPGDRLLSDYLSDKKIDRPLRDFLPVIAVGSRVLWVGGAGVAQDAMITERTRRRLRITLYSTSEDQTEVLQ